MFQSDILSDVPSVFKHFLLVLWQILKQRKGYDNLDYQAEIKIDEVSC